MSLISEALKKARQEAARQDALHQRAPYAVGSADARPQRNPLLPVLAGLGAGCLFAGLLFAVAWGAGWGPFSKSPAPAPVPGAEIAQTAPAAPPPAVEVREEAEEPLVPPAAVQTPPPRETPAPAPQPSVAERKPAPAPPPPTPPTAAPQIPVSEAEPLTPPAVNPVEPAPVAEPETSPPPATPAPPSAPAGGLEDGKVYTGEVPVPGGGSVKLNGIAYSQDLPVAVLDGRVMGPGEAIQGFTVLAIESNRVKLQGYGATVYLSPR
jgi:hypothetical protein